MTEEEHKPNPTETPPEEELRIGVYVCHCGSNIAGVIPPKEVVNFAAELPGLCAQPIHFTLARTAVSA